MWVIRHIIRKWKVGKAVVMLGDISGQGRKQSI